MEHLYHFERFSLEEKRRRFYNFKRSSDYKEQKINELARYVSEGNPNTEERIEEAQGKKSDKDSSKEENQEQYLYNDERLAQDIRTAIQKEESVPIDERRGIEVTVENGTVTLIGTVSSEKEKRTIGDKAVAFVGPGEVVNQLEVLEEE